MISSDTLFTTIISIFIFYATMLITLCIAKNQSTTFHIGPIIIVLTVICLLFILTDFVLYFEPVHFLQEVILKMQAILTIFDGTYFELEDFWYIYCEGFLVLSIFGVLCSKDAIKDFSCIILTIVDVLLNTITTLLLSYFVCSLIYHWLYSSISLVAFIGTLIVSFVANFLMGVLLMYLYYLLKHIDDII